MLTLDGRRRRLCHACDTLPSPPCRAMLLTPPLLRCRLFYARHCLRHDAAALIADAPLTLLLSPLS